MKNTDVCDYEQFELSIKYLKHPKFEKDEEED